MKAAAGWLVCCRNGPCDAVGVVRAASTVACALLPVLCCRPQRGARLQDHARCRRSTACRPAGAACARGGVHARERPRLLRSALWLCFDGCWWR